MSVFACRHCEIGFGTPTGKDRRDSLLEVACGHCGNVWYVEWNPQAQNYRLHTEPS